MIRRRLVALALLVSISSPGAVLAADAASSAQPAPAGIVVDGDGNLYVTDYAFDRLVKFGPDGSVLGQWGGSGNGPGQFSSPFGIALDDRGSVIIVDQLNNRVQRFATDGTVLGMWGTAGAAAGDLRTPFGVAASGGRVYVADFGNDRVQIYSADGSFLGSVGVHGSGDGQFLRPAGVAVDRDGTLYVTDHFNDRVERFGSDGHFQAQIGSPQVLTAVSPASSTPTASGGTGPSTVSTVTSLPAGNGQLGTTVGGVASAGTGTPAVPTVSPSSSLATATTGPAAVANPTADPLLRRPEGLVLDRDGNLWVADYGHDRVVKLSPDGRLLVAWGSRGSGPGEFVGPKGLAIDPVSNRLYVADTGNARIQRLAPDGTLEASWPLP